MPAEIPNGQMKFVNTTKGFQSMVSYTCDPGFVAVGRTMLMCDVDERWNGPPPRCDPVFCDEPSSIRNGGFSLSTNSTVVGTVASYYCTSPRHVLVGVPKLTCRKDGAWDAPTPECRPRNDQQPPPLDTAGIGAPQPSDQIPLPSNNRPGFPRNPLLGRPIRKNRIPITAGK